MHTITLWLIASALLFNTSDKFSVKEFNELTIAQATVEASQSDKDIFVLYHADWCLPCQLLNENILSNKQVQTILHDDFITINANIDDLNNQEWFEDFGVKSLPTMSVVSDAGLELTRFEGNSNYEEFLSWLHKNNRQNKRIKAQYNPPIQIVKRPETFEPTQKLTVVQFGAFSKYENALKLKEEIETAIGIEIIVHEDDTRLYKVLYTQELTNAELELIIDKIKANGIKYFIKT